MTRAQLTALAERAMAATENDADLFREAATVVFGKVPDAMNRMLAADAYLSAAEMFVPRVEKYWPQASTISTNPNNPRAQPNRVELWFKGRVKPVRGRATTPALALLAAALLARAEMEIE